MEELKSAFSRVPLPVFLVVPIETWRPGPQPWEEVYAREDLMHFVNQTGGYSALVRNKQEISTAMTHLGLVTRAPYVLLFPSPRPSGRPLDLRVEVMDMRPRPLVLYREVQIPQ
jgi:hypothetical protein